MNSETEVTWVNAVAPVRICDIGGWTDTWFARHGAVFNIAVYPFVEVQISCTERGRTDDRITISVENYGEEYNFRPLRKARGPHGELYTLRPDGAECGKHPLIETALDIMEYPKDKGLRVNIHSDVPPGASMGTSAAVSIALIGALDRLTRGRLTSHEVAMRAHSIETEHLHLQCGIQDQLASAYGGINFMQITDFPHAVVSPVHVPDPVWWELEQRLAVVYLGKPHRSSEIHERVIAGLGKAPVADSRLEALRLLAREAKDGLSDGDFARLGAVMSANTDVQRQLHPDLVCARAEETIGIAKEYGALGAKVNGAGGDGGSVTLLFGADRHRKRACLKALLDHGFRVLPVYLARRGLRVW